MPLTPSEIAKESQRIVETLESLKVDFPVLDPPRRAELATARKLPTGGRQRARRR